MARARNIKPGLYKNEDLAECSVWARYIFPGLWTLADREGRLEDRPKRIKGELLPFDSQDVEPLLRELAGRQFIVRYRSEGVSYIQISKFLKHQTPHYTEKPSLIKPQSLQESDDQICRPDSGSVSVIKTPSLPPDSLIPDSLIPDSLIPDSHDSPNPDCGKPRRTTEPAAQAQYPPAFESTWGVYPKRYGGNPKNSAARAWNARLKEGVSAEAITDGVLRYAEFVRAQGKENTEFVMQAVTFFGRDKHFLESWTVLPQRSTQTSRNIAAAQEFVRQGEEKEPE